MPAERSLRRYTTVAIILHWIMAIGIGALAILGLVMVHVKLAPMLTFKLYQLHKSIGITILLAAVLRLGWRVVNRPPPLPDTMPAAERQAAVGGHLALYGFLFGLPLVGWAMVSASTLNIPTVLYGAIPWPDLPVFSTLPDKAPVEGALKLLHAYGAYALFALISVHAAAALRHHFITKDDVLTRMLPIFTRPKPSADSGRPEGISS